LLVSALTQKVHSSHLDRSFCFAADETIYTGQSQKYTPAELRPAEAGWYGLGFSRVANWRLRKSNGAACPTFLDRRPRP